GPAGKADRLGPSFSAQTSDRSGRALPPAAPLRRVGGNAVAIDLAARLRQSQRTVRGKLARRDALVDVMRAVSATLDPVRIAHVIIARAATWVPAPSWAVVSADITGKLSVIAERTLGADLFPAASAVALWLMQNGGEFLSANLSADERVPLPEAPSASV